MISRRDRHYRRRHRAAWFRWLAWSAVGLITLFTIVELARTSPSLLSRLDGSASTKPSATAKADKPARDPAQLKLHVVGAYTSQNVTAAVVGVGDRYLTADESGTVRVPDLLAGVVKVTARAPGHEVFSDRIVLSAGENDETITLSPAVILSGAAVSTATPAYLTIDDGPHPDHTPRVLEILREEGVKATFFVVGRRAEANPDLVRRIYLEGHELGNHTYSHDSDVLYRGSARDYVRSLGKGGEVLRKIVGFDPALTRPPGGEAGNFHAGWRGTVRAAGYETMLWNVSSGDGTETTGDRMLANVRDYLDRLGPRDEPIILTHDVRPTIIEALPDLIAEVRRRGYEFVTSARR